MRVTVPPLNSSRFPLSGLTYTSKSLFSSLARRLCTSTHRKFSPSTSAEVKIESAYTMKDEVEACSSARVSFVTSPAGMRTRFSSTPFRYRMKPPRVRTPASKETKSSLITALKVVQ